MIINSRIQLIYADLPYGFGSKHYQDGGRDFKKISYVTMTQNEMESIKVKDVIADDAVCFIWTPQSRIPDCIKVMEAWGFTYVTVAFYWQKKYESGEIAYNYAPTTLNSMELCLYGTRGKVSQYKQCNNIRDFCDAVRTIHSRKPDEIRNRIDKLFGQLNKVEFFATQKIDGWESWGYDIDGKSVEQHIEEMGITELVSTLHY